MESFAKGYEIFRKKYVEGDQSIMQTLAAEGQKPRVMFVACCDSRVDPALILQCDPGDLFVVRNVANIIPPYEKDEAHHGTSAALEFAIKILNIDHLIILGHSQCGGIRALLNQSSVKPNDFIDNWVNVIQVPDHGDHGCENNCADAFARAALSQSYDNCLTFPWIVDKLARNELTIHRWFFEIEKGQIEYLCPQDGIFKPLA